MGDTAAATGDSRGTGGAHREGMCRTLGVSGAGRRVITAAAMRHLRGTTLMTQTRKEKESSGGPTSTGVPQMT
jgi:hypothetical protein